MGLYDFTDNQWHNQLRTRRIVIRGSAGEIANDEVVRLTGPRTIVRSPLVRRQTGYDLDLDGFDTDHISQDHLIALAMEESASAGEPVTTAVETWGAAGH